MKFITGTNINQEILFPFLHEKYIDKDNEVRVIDLYVDSFSLQDLFL
jgi:hypothetical protein